MSEHAQPKPTDLRTLLRDVFGYDEFRSCQEEIVSAVLERRDTLAVLPTGAGKSLCYQLPAAVLDGPTLVISPLISLMKDQFDNLPPALYEKATVINSAVPLDELNDRLAAIRAGKTKLIYAAPERLRLASFLSLISQAGVSLVVVDEAHCVAMWGHDFRPDYLFIRKALAQIIEGGARPTLLALTATATQDLQREIATQLGRPLHTIVAPLFRENLRLQVHSCANLHEKEDALIRLCKSTQGAAIVYANSRDRCEALATTLRHNGVRAEHYHARLEPDVRRQTQERFMLGRTRVIVATVAFGMGIDKANVRLVAHFSLPQSLEAYSQESGRAGRDGNPSTCALLYSPADRGNLTRWLKAEAVGVADVRDVYRTLKAMIAEGGETVDADELVERAFPGQDRSEKGTTARVAIAMLEACSMLVRYADSGRSMVICMLPAQPHHREALDKLIASRRAHAEARLDAIVGYATTSECRHAVLLSHFGQTMEPCEGSCDCCDGTAPKFDLADDHARARRKKSKLLPRAGELDMSEEEEDRFEVLRAWRRLVAREESIPAFMVFSDASLRSIARLDPRTPDELLDAHGVGPEKLRLYGEDVLETLRDHASGAE